MSQKNKSLIVRSAVKKDAKAIAQFRRVYQMEFELPFCAVKKILDKAGPRKDDIRDNENHMTRSSGFLLATTASDSIQVMQYSPEPLPYRIEDSQKKNVVGVLEYDNGSLKSYGNVVCITSIKALSDDRNQQQVKQRQTELLNAFLDQDWMKKADAMSISSDIGTDVLLSEMCGDLGEVQGAKYRLFIGQEQIKEFQGRVSSFKAGLVPSAQ